MSDLSKKRSFSIKDLQSEFKDPKAIMRTAPLWVWNAEMTNEEIEFALEELKNHGFGGVIIHPRPGMVITYLSEEWFTQWGYALQEAKKRNMKVYIYDENSYPSGFGGGHVSAELPDCLGTSVRFSIIEKEEFLQLYVGDKAEDKWLSETNDVKVFAAIRNGVDKLKLLQDITLLSRAEWDISATCYIKMEFMKGQTAGWLAGFANVDLMRPEVTEMFIKKVYDSYYQRFGHEFGTTIPAIFMDEPAITGSGVYGTAGGDVLPYSYWFGYEFYKENGYYIEDYLPALFCEVEAKWYEKSVEKIRYDYYNTVHKLWENNFVIPLAKWTKEHNIALTGHYMEDDWPRAGGPTTSPNIMAYYAHMGWPAIDMLINNKLLNQPHEQVGIIMYELRSVVNQFNPERCFCEAFGAGGWDSTLADFKRIGDWLMVGGVNFINPHLTFTSYLGARKRDHPQSFDWRQPWWEQWTKINDYFGRVCTVLSQGVMEQRILLLHPTMTGYMRHMDAEPSNLVVEDTLTTNPNMKPYLDIVDRLSDEQWDFDLGNEDLLAEHAMVVGDKLKLQNQTYQVILVTEEMKTFNQTTIQLLIDYLNGGGVVLCLGQPGEYVNGEFNPDIIAHVSNHENWRNFDNKERWFEEIGARIPSRLKQAHPFATGVEHMRRRLDDNYEVYFFVNHGMEKEINRITVQGEAVQFLDPWSGQIKQYVYDEKDGHVTFDVILNRHESALYLVGPSIETNEKVLPVCLQEINELPLTKVQVCAESINSYPIDYCDLELDGQTYKDIAVIYASKEIYKHRGFGENPWDNQVQFKNRYLERNNYEIGSGFTAIYYFEVKDIPQRAELVVEQGEKYNVIVNGQKVIWKEAYFLDIKNQVADIADYLQVGTNSVQLQNTIFDVQLELEPIYIRGEFTLVQENGKFVITKQTDLELGSWVHQGYPFYQGAVRYKYTWNNNTEDKQFYIKIPDIEMTSASLYVNGEEVTLVNLDGNRDYEITSFCKNGENIIELRVCGGMKNLLGPHHAVGNPRKTAWPEMWRQSPRFGKPSAEKYDFIPYGLGVDLKLYEKWK